jgi:hypothetical protein
MTASKSPGGRRFAAGQGWDEAMGVVIDFPKDRTAYRGPVTGAAADGRCEVVILPVIRIDRHENSPVNQTTGGRTTGARRRKRASRS